MKTTVGPVLGALPFLPIDFLETLGDYQMPDTGVHKEKANSYLRQVTSELIKELKKKRPKAQSVTLSIDHYFQNESYSVRHRTKKKAELTILSFLSSQTHISDKPSVHMHLSALTNISISDETEAIHNFLIKEIEKSLDELSTEEKYRVILKCEETKTNMLMLKKGRAGESDEVVKQFKRLAAAQDNYCDIQLLLRAMQIFNQDIIYTNDGVEEFNLVTNKDHKLIKTVFEIEKNGRFNSNGCRLYLYILKLYREIWDNSIDSPFVSNDEFEELLRKARVYNAYERRQLLLLCSNALTRISFQGNKLIQQHFQIYRNRFNTAIEQKKPLQLVSYRNYLSIALRAGKFKFADKVIKHALENLSDKKAEFFRYFSAAAVAYYKREYSKCLRKISEIPDIRLDTYLNYALSILFFKATYELTTRQSAIDIESITNIRTKVRGLDKNIQQRKKISLYQRDGVTAFCRIFSRLLTKELDRARGILTLDEVESIGNELQQLINSYPIKVIAEREWLEQKILDYPKLHKKYLQKIKK